MGIFSKKKSTNQTSGNVDTDVDFNDFMPTYTNLAQSLARELSLGSKDVKRTSFTSESREIKYDIYSVGAEIKGVFDNNKKFSLAERLKFIVDAEAAHAGLTELEVLSSDDDLSRFSEFVDSKLIDEKFLKKVFLTVATENAIDLNEVLRTTDDVETWTEIVDRDKLVKVIKGWNYISMSSDDFYDFCEEELKKTEEILLTLLSDTSGDPEILKLELVNAKSPETDEDKAVQWFADKNATLDEMSLGIDGFHFSDILASLQKNVEKSEIVIFDPTVVVEENLPDVLDTLEDSEDNHEEDGELDDDFEWDLEEDTFEKEDSDIPHFIPTGYIYDSIEKEVIKVLSSINVSYKIRRKAETNASKNEFFESEVAKIEKVLEPMSDEYGIRIATFNELRDDKTFGDMEKEYLDPSEGALQTLDTEPEIVKNRDESNEVFFELEKTEKSRYELNQARKKELYSLLECLPEDSGNELVNSLRDRIEDKLRGINHVRAIAFQEFVVGSKQAEEAAEESAAELELMAIEAFESRVDEENEDPVESVENVSGDDEVLIEETTDESLIEGTIDELLVDEITDEPFVTEETADELEDVAVTNDKEFDGHNEESENHDEEVVSEKLVSVVDIHGPQGREHYPESKMYYKLVDAMGFDPLELYKEDMRLIESGVNPNLPRLTKWSRKLNESYVNLTEDERAKVDFHAAAGSNIVTFDKLFLKDSNKPSGDGNMLSKINKSMNKNETAFIVDLKGSQNLVEALSSATGKDVISFPVNSSPVFYDPLSGLGVEEKVVAVLGMREYDDSSQLYETSMKNVLEAIFNMLENADREKAPNIDWNHGVIYQLSSVVNEDNLLELMFSCEGTDVEEDSRAFVESIVDQSTVKHAFQELEKQLKTIVETADSSWLKVEDVNGDVVDLSKDQDKNVIFSLDSEGAPEYTRYLSSLIIADFNRVVKMRKENSFKNNIRIFIDELPALNTVLLNDLIENSSESGVSVVVINELSKDDNGEDEDVDTSSE